MNGLGQFDNSFWKLVRRAVALNQDQGAKLSAQGRVRGQDFVDTAVLG